MNLNLTNLLTKWTEATNDAPWGVQQVFHDVFDLASEGKTTLIYGSDFRDGNPCLVNTVGVMLSATGGKAGEGLPSQHFGEIVSLFDRINVELFEAKVNTQHGYVSPMAAEVFLHHFAPLKEKPEVLPETEPFDLNPVFVEPSDEDMAKAVAEMFLIQAPCEIVMDENNVNSYEVRSNGLDETFAHVRNDSES